MSCNVGFGGISPKRPFNSLRTSPLHPLLSGESRGLCPTQVTQSVWDTRPSSPGQPPGAPDQLLSMKQRQSPDPWPQPCRGIRGGKEKTNNPLGQGPCLFPLPFPVLFTKDQKPTCKPASRNERITIGKSCKKINHTTVW